MVYKLHYSFFAMGAMIFPHLYTLVPSDDPNVCWIYFLTTAPFRLDDIDPI